MNLFVESTRQQPLTHIGYERIDPAWLHPRELWMKNICGKCEPQGQPECCKRSYVRREKVQHFSPGVWFYLVRDMSNVRSAYKVIGKKPVLRRLPLAWQVCASYRPYQRYRRQCRRKSWQYLRVLHRRTIPGHPLKTQKGRQREEIRAYMQEVWKGNIRSLGAIKELNAMPNRIKLLPTDFFKHLH